MEGEILQPDQLLKVDIDGEVDAVFIDRTLFLTAGRIAQHFADIGDGELDALLLERIWQQAERRFLDRALTCIRVRRLEVVGLLVAFLRDSGRQQGREQQKCEKTTTH